MKPTAMKNSNGSLLSDRYEQLLLTEKYHDCVFHLGGGVAVKAHRLILSAASPVFEAMFYGKFEVEQNIEIRDLSPEVFRILMMYIYTSRVDYEQLTVEQAIELYYGAEKYLLGDELIGACQSAITRKLRYSNILGALELSVCMNFDGLLEVCMSFFQRCCLGDDPQQYARHLKAHYPLHISKECLKTIIALNRDRQPQLLWFIYEWCRHECQALGLQSSDAALVIDELQLQSDAGSAPDSQLMADQLNQAQQQQKRQRQCRTIERIYYRACRPFTVDGDAPEWRTVLKSDRFIALTGLVLHSRLAPNIITALPNFPSEYNETLLIEIRALRSAAVANSDGEDSDHEPDDEGQPVVIWRHSISKQPTKYNCNLNVKWEQSVVLAPDVDYQLRLSWQTDAYGAEYPCSLQSEMADGIEFRDFGAQYDSGSLLKGLRFTNLI